MLWVALTVICYTISSLGDKYIASRLKCKPAEFTFIVSFATAVWFVCLLPFTGWNLRLNMVTAVQLLLLIVCKLGEFYSSAFLLKTVSAYELKVWLGINIVLSYFCNVVEGKSSGSIFMAALSLILFLGIAMIVRERREAGKAWQHIFLCGVFILSKFFYGIVMGAAARENEKISVLIVVLLIIAVLQLPKVNLRKLFYKKGMAEAVATRIPNAGGLLFEAVAATENIFLYAMVQPVQLLILFVAGLIQKEKMGRAKLAGSLLCIFSIFFIAILKI